MFKYVIILTLLVTSCAYVKKTECEEMCTDVNCEEYALQTLNANVKTPPFGAKIKLYKQSCGCMTKEGQMTEKECNLE